MFVFISGNLSSRMRKYSEYLQLFYVLFNIIIEHLLQ